MNTCGGCRNYSNNSCYSTKAAFSLLDDVYRDTPACEHFEPVAQVAAIPDLLPALYRDPMDILSQETRDKLRATRRGWEG